MIKSPINYMGSKRRLLKQILPLFPENIDTFYDLFAGGGIVSLNTQAKCHVWNDINKSLVLMFKDLATLEESSLGILKELAYQQLVRDNFEKLRNKYNQHNGSELDQSIWLYLLIISSFNGLPRFNKQGDYNMPWLSTDHLNKNFLTNKINGLQSYIDQIQSGNYKFTCKSYDKVIDFNKVSSDDFVYFDPPYTMTTATYNDGNRNQNWEVKDDVKLLNYIEKLDQAGIKFALSNVINHRGEDNQLLIDWLNRHDDLQVHHLNMNYSNSTYHTKTGKSDEVLITNY